MSPIIDAHHHIWSLAETPWLNGPLVPRIFGDYAPLQRDYTIGEYVADCRPSGVVGSIHVQANVAANGEIDEVARVAADGAGFIAGIVGFADLSDPDVGRVLDAQRKAGPLRGIRQQLHWHARPEYRYAARPDAMNDPAWRNGLTALAERGLLFELQVFLGQFADALAVVDAAPDVPFVLLHAGMPEDRSAEAMAFWRDGMVKFAERPNVEVKLSGLGTFDRSCTFDRWYPIVDQTVSMFGAERCLFGSNFPIEKLWTDYATLIATMRACLAGYSAHEQRLIFHDNAVRRYRLAPQRDGVSPSNGD